MTAAFSKLKERLAGWRSWEINPVVVKELRQAVRSWAVTGMLLLFLVVLFCTALGLLVGQSFQMNIDQRIGARIFAAFLVILTGASLTFIPTYVGVRLAAERQESNFDLLYITTLSPARIIRGKFLCGVYMAALFFSACMPFMVFTNLLRGVDLPTIFFILLCLFLAVCAGIQVAIFLACLPISKLLKILVALIGIIFSFGVVVPLVAWFFLMMQSGVGSMMGRRDFWVGFFTLAGIVLAAVLLLYFLSVALISPLSANRALPVRVYLTVIWLLGAVDCFFWMRKMHDARLMLPWAIVSLVLLAPALLVVISNNDQLSLRVRRRIPVNPLKRAVAFLFYNGAAGGFVWITLLAATTLGVTYWFLHFPPGPVSGPYGPMVAAAGGSASTLAMTGGVPSSTLTLEDRNDFEVTTGAAVLYALAYGLTALFLHRQLLSRRSPRLAGTLAVLLVAGWALLPNILYFFLNRLTWKSLEQVQLGNIFNVFVVRDPDKRAAHLVCAGVWLLLMLAVNAKWFIRQIKRFQPLQRPVSTPPTIGTPIAISTATECPTVLHGPDPATGSARR